MTIRIEPKLEDTEELLGQILQVILPSESRVAFLVPAGQADKVMLRLRVMITRKRKKLQGKGRKPKRFKLRSTTHKETHEGRRFDCLVVWRHVDESHLMTQDLEDMLSNG